MTDNKPSVCGTTTAALGQKVGVQVVGGENYAPQGGKKEAPKRSRTTNTRSVPKGLV